MEGMETKAGTPTRGALLMAEWDRLPPGQPILATAEELREVAIEIHGTALLWTAAPDDNQMSSYRGRKVEIVDHQRSQPC
jgi:hypothetical protein